jgi:hypothetical protein
MRRFALAGLVGLLPAPLAAQEVAWEGALAVATGTYLFTERTTGWTLTNGIAATAGPLSLRVSWPLLLQNSALVTSSGSTWIPTGGPYSGMVADSGAARGARRGGGTPQSLDVPVTAVSAYTAALGDPMAQASVRIGPPTHGLTLHAAAKAPLADTASFGTGRWDFGAGAALTYMLGRGGFLGADVSWWHLGDLQDLDFRDPIWGTLSSGATFASGWAGLLSVSGGTSALAGYEGPWSVGASLSRVAGPTMVGLSAALGLTDTAPQLSLAMAWRVRF